ncbi:hypothetical protein F5Y15DRAFT_409507 [Xylariaceae sp. FL0016]|nr:hypothetical protein F5Y15DRAFT_409507 [Xylariaceae sp. FL0016]
MSVLTLQSLSLSNTTTTTATPTAPCAIVSSAWAAQSSATATPTVEASVAYDCLNSVPIDKEAALKFITEMEPYIEWQSDTVWKKDPPADYFYPPHDIWGVIDEIKSNIEADKYANEYAWQADLYVKLFGPAHDGHFVVYPDALSGAIEWQRPLALVSISEDGPSGTAPVIKVYEDVMSSPDTASVVQLINGVDAATYVEDWINQAGGNQDVDAAYNSMFFEKAFLAENANLGYFQSGGRVRYIYPGNTTSFTFENGTEIELSNVARIKGVWTGVVDGPTFFAHFCGAADSSAEATASTTTPATTTATAAATATAGVEGYPVPIVVSSDAVISGYFLEGEGFEDVAVLSMLSFSPSDPVEFQRVAQDFFAACVQAGKKKLVVDVQANGGGYIFSGYDIFRQIFPDIVQEGLGHWREHAGFNAVSQVFSALAADFDPATATSDEILAYESIYNWRYDVNITDKHFSSYEDKFAPHAYHGDNFTNLVQWDFNDPLSTINATYGFGTDITGYGSRQNFTRPFGGPENVVVLLDGYCASTCTLFAEFMKSDAGVQSISMGGRPGKQGLIQGVGGIKGSQSYDFDNVLADTQQALRHTNDTALVAALSPYTEYVSRRSTAAALNVKNQILPGSIDDGVPAQFVAEYADCRLWWTAAMHADIRALWKAAAGAAFGREKCAFGSIGGAANATATAAKAVRRMGSAAAAPRPALFGRRSGFTLPGPNTVKREVVAKDARAMANQFMKVID